MPLSREEMLGELRFLATVEHSLIVENLTVHCVLGQDMAPAPTPNGQRVAAAAQTAVDTAIRDMKHLHQLNLALTRAGRGAEVGRAAAIDHAGGEIRFGRLAPADLEHLLDREGRIASAVDDRYARLRPADEAPGPVFEPDPLIDLSDILAFNLEHRALFAELQGRLSGVEFSEYGRVTRLDAAGDLERNLLAVSDGYYRLVVTLVRARFAHEDELGSEVAGRAQTEMDNLRSFNLLLAIEGLLPAFAL
jgi:hypothetical protein